MAKLLIIGLGGFFGTVARYGVTVFASSRFGDTFPFGTVLVNVLGCLIVGACLFVSQEKNGMSQNLQFFFVIGLLGAFTTFSTFGSDTFKLFQTAQVGYALTYIGCNVLLGLGAVYLGFAATKLVYPS